MNDLDENDAVTKVVGRLSGQFPDIDVSHIEDVVNEAHQQFVGAPVRDYVPVLIEHQAKKRFHSETGSIGQLRLV